MSTSSSEVVAVTASLGAVVPSGAELPGRTSTRSATCLDLARDERRWAVLAALAATLAAPAHAGLFGASSSKQKTPKPDVEYATTPPVAAAAAPADGAIFHASYGYAPLTSGARAAMVGDSITILLVEKTQAVKTNSASTDRSGNIGVTPPSTGPLSFFTSSDASLGAGGTFKGTGAAAQSNQLDGAVTVTVALANGYLLVKGQKILTLNRGEEEIRISGIVRPADILPDNSVLSTRVGDARITYSGSGEIARASTQGWLGRFFSRISPF